MKNVIIILLALLSANTIFAQCDLEIVTSNPIYLCDGDYIPPIEATASSDISWYDEARTFLGKGNTLPGLEMLSPGEYIFYAIQDGCSVEHEIQLVIFALPVATINMPDVVCIGDSPFDPIVSPPGGLFDVNGMQSLLFDPSQLGGGVHSITYNYTDEKGCAVSVEQEVEVIDVEPPAAIDFIYPFGETIMPLTVSTPIGGEITWYADPSLTEVLAVGDTYFPEVTQVGMYEFWVTQTILGCESNPTQITLTVVGCTVNDIPTVEEDTLIMYPGEEIPTFKVTNVPWMLGVQWFDQAGSLLLIDSMFTPAISETATYQVAFFDTLEGCVGDMIPVTLLFECGINPPVVSQTEYSIVLGEPVPELTISESLALEEEITWIFNKEETKGISFTPEINNIGTYEVLVKKYNADVECSSQTKTITIEVSACMDKPVVSDSLGVFYLNDTMPTLKSSVESTIWRDREFNIVGEGLEYTPEIFKTGFYVFYAQSKDGACESELVPIYFRVRAYSVSGTVFVDLNDDKTLDPSDIEVKNAKIYIEETGAYITTNYWGSYLFETDSLGTYKIQLLNNRDYKMGEDSIHNVTLNQQNQSLIKKDFCLQGPNYYNLEAYLSSSTPTVGRTQYHYITIKNEGMKQRNIFINFSFDNDKSSFSSCRTEYHSQIGNEVEFIIDSLGAFEQKQITILTKVNVDWTLSDSTLLAKLSVSSANADNSPDNNIDSTLTVIVNSYDPNDKNVTPAFREEGYVLLESELKYLIRFQNKGTGPAWDIYIRDTIDDNLDISTFEVTTESHNMHYTIEDRVVTFYFDNIMLPAEKVDSTGSNGYVGYTISPIGGMIDETEVKNTAYIYFDFNPPVITNTTQSTYVDELPLTKEAETSICADEYEKILIYPNPVHNELFISNSKGNIRNISIVNTLGKTVLEKDVLEESITIDCSTMAPGVYYVNMFLENGEELSKKITIE